MQDRSPNQLQSHSNTVTPSTTGRAAPYECAQLTRDQGEAVSLGLLSVSNLERGKVLRWWLMCVGCLALTACNEVTGNERGGIINGVPNSLGVSVEGLW